MTGWLNVSTRKVGGLRFVKIGRLTISFSVSRRYKSLNSPRAPLHVVHMPVQLVMCAPPLRRAAR